MIKKPYIILIGAFERDNFGDILFPKIYEKVFPDYGIIKLSLLGRDLTYLGGDRVVSVKNFFENKLVDMPSAIIHCGGETLTLPKKSGVSMNLSQDFLQNNKTYYPAYEDWIASKITQSKSPLAYVYGYSDLPETIQLHKIPIAFNSVGGSGLGQKNKKKLAKALGKRLVNARYISVRDEQTKNMLDKLLKLKSSLVPDVVTLISKTHKLEIENASKDARIERIMKLGKYIHFQASKDFLENYGLGVFAHELTCLTEQVTNNLVLQPAGLAGGHGSLETLGALAKAVERKNPEANVIIQSDRNIWKQAAVISKSLCSIGTSLHLRVVSLSFESPAVSLVNAKVNSYSESWPVDKMPYNVNPTEIFQETLNALKISKNEIVKGKISLMEKTELGMRSMADTLGLKYKEKFNFITKETLPDPIFASLSNEANNLRITLAKELTEKYKLEDELLRLKNDRVRGAIKLLISKQENLS